MIRTRSVHSNRQAPSLDIARSFDHMHAVRHLISGGWVPVLKDKHDLSPPTYRQAGSSVCNLAKDKVFVKLMGLSHFFSKNTSGQDLLLSKKPY